MGTMIELPRAALTADDISKEADFFSFGTNDLTQTTFGLSRDDAFRFLPFYVDSGIRNADPSKGLDREGAGRLFGSRVGPGGGRRAALMTGWSADQGGGPRAV